MTRAGIAALALISGTILLLEVALTRYFSFQLWYHYAFLIISVALLGLSAAAVVLAFARRRNARIACPVWAVLASLACGCTTLAALPLLALLNNAGVLGAESTASSFWLVAGYWTVLFLPFFCGGLAVSWAISTYADRIATAYASDLFGAAVGVGVAVVTLSHVDAERAMALAAAASGLAGLLFVPSWTGRWRLAVVGAVVLTLAAALVAIVAPPLSGARTITGTKGLALDLVRGGKIVATRHTITGRVDVVGGLVTRFASGLGTFHGEFPDQLTVRIDGDAMTMVTHRAAGVSWRFTDVMPSTLPYAMAAPQRVLLIGPGGGMDVANALDRGATRVVGVEINRGIVDLMRGELAAFSGNIYNDPRVEIVESDGRNYVERTSERFELIQLTLVDTFAAIASGALTLSEDFLYTSEAFDRYISALTPDGYLVLGRTIHEKVPLTALAWHATRERGIDLAKHLFMIENPSSRHSFVFVFKRSPLTPAEIERGRAFAAQAGLRVVYAPGHGGSSDVDRLLASPDPAGFIASYPHDIAPETDDAPFYFRSSKWNALLGTYTPGRGNLLIVLAVALVFGLAFVLWPLAVVSRGQTVGAGWGGAIAYFFFIGLGFIVIELGLMVRFSLFLGHPVRALTVVLAGLLLATGLGSALSKRLAVPLPWVIGAALVLTLAYAYGLPRLFPMLMGFELWARIGMSLALIAPLGVLLGMPLPRGIAALGQRGDDLVLWAWGMNGLASVIGSTLCILIAHVAGYTMTFVVGAACYVIAVLLFVRFLSRTEADVSPR